MNVAEFYERELERLKGNAERGDYEAVVEAFLLLAWREPPFPEWLENAVMESLELSYERGGTGGKGGRGGSYAKQTALRRIHLRRWGAASMQLRMRNLLSAELGRRARREDAFRAASECLRGTPAYAGWQTVEDSYNQIQAEKKALGEIRAD